MTYTDALAYLDTFLDYEKARLHTNITRQWNLRRMERLLRALGDPHRELNVVHVAGTKGKGSTCAFLERVLRVSGYRTGMYTQPHLVSPRERFLVNGRCISEERFAALVERLHPQLEAHRYTDCGRLTFFEVCTALAFAYFAEEAVDLAVIEVGLGGRLDATNVVMPLVSVITPVGLDHLVPLGNTVERIAREKAGIIKHRRPVVTAPQLPAADRVLKRIAAERNAPQFEVDASLEIERFGIEDERERCRFSWRNGTRDDLRLRMLGAHQVTNAATAAVAVHRLREAGWDLPEKTCQRGLNEAMICGRFHISRERSGRILILDAAHTSESAHALRQTLTEVFPDTKPTFVVGMSSDKNATWFATVLAPIASEVFVTRTQNSPRATDPRRLADSWKPLLERVTIASSLADAVEQASNDLICVTGSVHFVGEAFDTVAREARKQLEHEVGL